MVNKSCEKKLPASHAGLFFLLMLNSGHPSAQEQASQTADGVWHGQGELGYVRTTGSSSTRTIGSKFTLNYQRERWRNGGRLEALSSTNQDRQIAERYFAGFKTEYAIEDRDYVATIIEYEDERFSTYDYRINHTLVFGRKFIEDPSVLLNGEAGVGSRRSREESGAKQDDTTLRIGVNLNWTISQSASLTEEFNVISGDEDTATRSVTGLTTRINGRIATKLTYLAKRINRLQSAARSTDTETTMTLVYSF